MIVGTLKTSVDFTASKPPPGYIPGIGRGAIGFMTRSDIGPARANPEIAAAGAVRGSGVVPGAPSSGASASGGASSGGERKFDSFSGYDERLFANGAYDAEDADADAVYAAVDAKMELRSKRRREEREGEAVKRARMETSRIGDEFVDLRASLASVTAAEWEGIPDIGDRSLRFKPKADNYTPVPDSVVEMGRGVGVTGAIDPRSSAAGVVTDIRGLSEARGQMLSLKLDKMSDSVGGQTVVDPKGYLTSLGASAISAETDVEDVKKARLLLKSVILTNPHHGPGWIAAARLEEQVRNLPAARKLIKDGCERCPTDEDVWLEAARLQPALHARVVLADAVKHIPHSVNVWLRAAELESEVELKKAVLRKALTLIPNSEKLWKTAISLEGQEDARIMLSRAVECVPTSVDMWLALAKLETYEAAQRVLNQARQAVPTDASIWLAAAKLEETKGHVEVVPRIITRALKSLVAQQVQIDRETWMKHAEDAERAQTPATAAAIISATLDVGVDEVDRKRTWLADALALQERGSIACARAVYVRLLEVFASSEGVWQRAAALEKKHGTPETLHSVLQRGYTAVPQSEMLWLMAAKEKWLAGELPVARDILRQAFAANPASSQIWLAAAKLEWESDEFDRARVLLRKARVDAPGARVWMKSAMLERELGDVAAEERLLLEGAAKFPTFFKLWMMLAQLYDRTGHADKAREALHAGLRQIPTCIPMWLLAARLEERVHGTARARTLLETARLRNAANPELLLESIRLERRAGNDKIAETLMSRALQECPTSGLLLAEDLLTAVRATQKRKSQDALKKCDGDVHVTLAIAKLFWQDRKYENARRWFFRAAHLDTDLGDAWIMYYAFESLHGSPGSVRQVEDACVAAEPAHGDMWQRTAKRVENRRCSKLDILRLATAEMKAAEIAAGSTLWEQRPAGLPTPGEPAATSGAVEPAAAAAAVSSVAHTAASAT